MEVAREERLVRETSDTVPANTPSIISPLNELTVKKSHHL